MSSDANLTLRLLRELRADVQNLNQRMDRVEQRLGGIENTMGGMASHLFSITNILNNHERRIRKLEGRSSK